MNVAINRRQAEKILDENEEFGNMLLRKREKDPTDSWSYAVSIKYECVNGVVVVFRCVTYFHVCQKYANCLHLAKCYQFFKRFSPN